LEDSGNPLTYTFTRNGPIDAPLTINFLISGSADPSTDYTANCNLSNFPLGIITFNAGDSVATLEITPIADATIEADETIEIELLATSEYAVGTVGPVVATIINDDVSPSILDITATDATKPEGNGGNTIYTFTVTRSGDTSGSSTAAWAVSSAQATGDDFIGGVLPTGTVTFASGDTSKTITVEVNGDINLESDENFRITLTNPTGATITTASADGTIVNDDTSTTISISPAFISQNEGTSGSPVSGSFNPLLSSLNWDYIGNIQINTPTDINGDGSADFIFTMLSSAWGGSGPSQAVTLYGIGNQEIWLDSSWISQPNITIYNNPSQQEIDKEYPAPARLP
jgi:hypothetical protein